MGERDRRHGGSRAAKGLWDEAGAERQKTKKGKGGRGEGGGGTKTGAEAAGGSTTGAKNGCRFGFGLHLVKPSKRQRPLASADLSC